MTQTEEFMFQNGAYRPTVYRTGVTIIAVSNPSVTAVRAAKKMFSSILLKHTNFEGVFSYFRGQNKYFFISFFALKS